MAAVDEVVVEEADKKSFEEIGIDPRLIRALTKKAIEKPTPIQQSAIPYILEGKDVVGRAKTGSGKTLAYLLPLLQKLFGSKKKKKSAPSAFILLPSKELCHQVFEEVSSLIKLCRVQLKAVKLLTSDTTASDDMRKALAEVPEILVSTPTCISNYFAAGVLERTAINDSLEILVLDEADLLLSYGYEDNLKLVTSIIPIRCQRLLMSATMCYDVEKLKKSILHNPVVLTLQEKEESHVPSNVQQYWISCSAEDKLLYILALLLLEVVQKKILIFVNTINMGFKLKLFLKRFGIKSAILNGELPQNCRLHILKQFNAGLFDYLIATDDNNNSQTKENEDNKKPKRKLDAEFGVVRGIDFKNVYTVINYDMPLSVTGYIHRVGRTGRAYSSGSSVSLVCPDEVKGFEEIKLFLAGEEDKDSDIIKPFPSLTKNAVEFLRYRAADVCVTKRLVRESRAEDFRNEIIKSEKLKSYFEANPRDLDLLKHDDKPRTKTAPPAPHLGHLPDYIVDPETQEASKMVKLARAAMGNSRRGGRNQTKKKRSRKGGSDPLKTFTANGSKRGHGKKDGKGSCDGSTKHKKQKIV